jgi:PAS domain S-box/DNA binding domain, excisionase family
MNLKEAARRLDVHYQTAYKWVRSGELRALRVGARYEISEGAITQFLATRRSVLSEVTTPAVGPRDTDVTQEDVLEELEAMATDPLVAESSAVTLAARRGADVLGDMCLVVRIDENGERRDAAVNHADPDYAAFVSAALAATDARPTLDRGMASVVLTTGRPVRVPHVPQDQLRASIRPELVQYLAQYAICGLLAAPITANGTTSGFVAFTRDSPRNPYTAADEEFAMRFGARIGRLFETSQEIKLAWQIRRKVADALRGHIDGHRAKSALTDGSVERLFHDHPASLAFPVAVLDAHCRFVTANETFLANTGYAPGAIAGRSIDSLTHPDDRTSDRANFERLVSGEVDYLDIHGRRVLADGTYLDYASHRVAVRDPNATLHSIVTVLRPLRTQTATPDPVPVGVS